jgi:hypothetical protein
LTPKILFQRATRAHLSVYDAATMAVAMRESWTDDRLDDFRDEVNRRFDKFEAEMDRRFDKVDEGFDRVNAKMDRRFSEVNGEIKRLDSKMDALQHTMMLTGGGIIATLIAGIISLVVTQV